MEGQEVGVMKMLFVWTGLTSYMGDCWRELAKRSDIDLKVIVVIEKRNAVQISFQAEDVLRGLDYKLVDDDAAFPDLGGWRPDIIFSVGWRSRVCRYFVEDESWTGIPKVCCFDMPWRWKFRCLVAPLVLGRFLRNYDAAFVPGVVCERYAKWLGFKRIFKGLFGIKTERFYNGRRRDEKPYLLYVGRNSPEKRLDVLQEGYRLYRERGGKLELRLYGKDLANGFVEPEKVPGLMKSAAAFVLASDFDPWPLVLLESMSAGCMIVASDRCTNRPELGKNWFVFKHGKPGELARELARVEKAVSGDVDVIRGENRNLAARYDCAEWVKRVDSICREFNLKG